MMTMVRNLCSSLAVAGVICAAAVSRAEADGVAPPERLVLRESHAIFAPRSGLKEPSGLAVDPATGTLMTVSDDSRHVFLLDIGGGITRRLDALSGLEDAEAVDIASDGRLLLLSEKLGAILSVDPAAPDEATLHPLSQMQGFDAFLAVADGDPDRLSPEGLAVNRLTGSVLVANERDPRVLIEVSPALDRILGVTLLSRERGFVCPHADDDALDASGLAHDPARDGLWITSDTGKCVFFWDGSQRPARHFELVWRDGNRLKPVDNAEGVALGPDGDTLLVLTDDGKTSRLFHYGIE